MAVLLNKKDYELPELNYDNVITWSLSSFRIKNSSNEEEKKTDYIFNKINVDYEMFEECFNMIRINYNNSLNKDTIEIETYSSQNFKKVLNIL